MPYKIALTIFVISFVVLGWLGMQAVTDLYTLLARIFTALYFAFFILMPWFTSIGKTKEEPARTTE
jgi:ubiquinol-cytochrome c reductase cytochrome b subunit